MGVVVGEARSAREQNEASRTAIKPQAGFRAELPGLDLPTLIQMTCARRERLVVRVASYGEEGFLFSAEGRILHATLGELVGEEAVLRMLSWSSGEFTVVERAFPQAPTVHTSTEGLLLRAAQRTDEEAHEAELDFQIGPDPAFVESPKVESPKIESPKIEAVPTPPPPPPRSGWPLADPVAFKPVAVAAAPRAWPLPAADLPPVSLPHERSPQAAKPRLPPPPPPRRPRVAGEPVSDSSLIASVRIDARGGVMSKFGEDERFAQLVAYVSRVASLVQTDFALDPFEAMHVELAGKRVLIFADGSELVGLMMKPSSSAQELRQKLRV